MIMKTKSITLFIVSAIICSSAIAQGKNDQYKFSAEEKAQFQTECMAMELDLTDEQKQKVLKINEKYSKKHQAEKRKELKQKEERKAKRDELKHKQNKELIKVLTPAQFDKLKEMKKQRVCPKANCPHKPVFAPKKSHHHKPHMRKRVEPQPKETTVEPIQAEEKR